MDELDYQLVNAIVCQIVEKLRGAGEEDEMLTLILTMMAIIKQMSAQIANNNVNNNGTRNGQDD